MWLGSGYLAGAGEGGGDGHLHQGPGRHVQLLDRHDGLVQVVVHRHLQQQHGATGEIGNQQIAFYVLLHAQLRNAVNQ